MALSDFDRLFVEHFPDRVDLFTDEMFAFFLVAKVPQEEWPRWIATRVRAGSMERWSIKGVTDAALGKPVSLGLPNSRPEQEARKREAVKELERDPAVQAELDRLRALWRTAPANDDGSPPLSKSAQVYDEAHAFAERHEVKGVHPDDLAMFLWVEVVGGFDVEAIDDPTLRASVRRLVGDSGHGRWVLRDTKPQAWVNLKRKPVNLSMQPGAIFIEVTHSTREDLLAAWDAIEEAQKKLGRTKPTGGRPRKHEIYRRALDLKKTRSWLLTWRQIQREFPAQAPPTPDALRQGCLRFRRERVVAPSTA